eukprot:778263_1
MNSKTSFVIISALYLLQTTKSVNDCSDECDGHPDYWKACEDVGGCSKCTPCEYAKPDTWPSDIKAHVNECKVVTIDGTTHCVHKSVCEYCWECPLPITNHPASWQSFMIVNVSLNVMDCIVIRWSLSPMHYNIIRMYVLVWNYVILV